MVPYYTRRILPTAEEVEAIRNESNTTALEALRRAKRIQLDDALNDLSTAIACDSKVDLSLALLDLIEMVRELNKRK